MAKDVAMGYCRLSAWTARRRPTAPRFRASWRKAAPRSLGDHLADPARRIPIAQRADAKLLRRQRADQFRPNRLDREIDPEIALDDLDALAVEAALRERGGELRLERLAGDAHHHAAAVARGFAQEGIGRDQPPPFGAAAHDNIDMAAERFGEGGFELRLEPRRLCRARLEQQIAGRDQRTRILQAERLGHPAQIRHGETTAAAEPDTVQQRNMGRHGFPANERTASIRRERARTPPCSRSEDYSRPTHRSASRSASPWRRSTATCRPVLRRPLRTRRRSRG